MISIECWKVVADFPDYMVSQLGRVKNARTGRILKPYLADENYYELNLWHERKAKHVRVHRLVALSFCEGYASGLEPDHIDGDKTNNVATNLEWVTHAENGRRAYALGFNRPTLRRNVRPIEIVETGEVFESAAACARAIGGRQSTIQKLVNGICKTHLGFTYRYADV